MSIKVFMRYSRSSAATFFERELGCETTVVATGGLAPTVIDFCDHDIKLDDNLLLDGLKVIYSKNK